MESHSLEGTLKSTLSLQSGGLYLLRKERGQPQGMCCFGGLQWTASRVQHMAAIYSLSGLKFTVDSKFRIGDPVIPWSLKFDARSLMTCCFHHASSPWQESGEASSIHQLHTFLCHIFLLLTGAQIKGIPHVSPSTARIPLPQWVFIWISRSTQRRTLWAGVPAVCAESSRRWPGMACWVSGQGTLPYPRSLFSI